MDAKENLVKSDFIFKLWNELGVIEYVGEISLLSVKRHYY